MQKRFLLALKRFLPALVVILLLPVVIALIFLPESFLYIPPEGFSPNWFGVIGAGLFFFIVFASTRARSKNTDPIAQRLLLLVLIPIPIGFGLYFIFGNPILFMAGIGISFLIGAWINYLRFHPRFWQIIKLTRQNQTSKAIQLLNSRIQTDPGDWMAFQLRAGLHLSQLQFVNAERDARTVIKLRSGKHHEDFFLLSQILHSQALYEDARQVILTAISMKPDPSYYSQLGIECHRLEKHREAIDALLVATRSTLPLTMGNLMANYYLGRSFELTGNNDEADKYFRKMGKYRHNLKSYMEQIETVPDYPEAIRLRADYADIERRLSSDKNRNKFIISA